MKKVIRKFDSIGKMQWFNVTNVCRLDWIISLLILAFLFVTFISGDIVLTGNRSFLYLQGATDFYKASYEQSQGFYANYLPSTFVAFAIWNLPLYLVGRVPAAILEFPFLNLMWYKLLPVILYFVTAHFIYKIGCLLNFGEEKARICKMAFLLSPIAVYSQFIFSQYDIFTVFFMVAGLYFYFRNHKNDKLRESGRPAFGNDMLWFTLMFGIAATFKYHALAYFAVLLVLREKKILKILKYCILVALPLAIEIIPHLNSPYFYRCVLGFSALNFVDGGLSFGLGSINIALVVVAFLLVWTYQKETVTKEEQVSWALFFTGGVSFAIFGFTIWNPQWLLMLVPFLVLSIFVNKNSRMLLLLLNIFIIALYVYSVNRWAGIADEQLMIHGIFKFVIGSGTMSTTMSQVYGFQDKSILLACIWVILLVYFVFSHPKFHTNQGNRLPKYTLNYVRLAFLAGVIGFAAPAGVCMAKAIGGECTFMNTRAVEQEACNPIAVKKGSTVRQVFAAEGEIVNNISVRMGMYNRINDSVLTVRILDKEDDSVVYETNMNTISFVKEESMYRILNEDVPVEEGKEYILELSSDTDDNDFIAVYYTDADEGDYLAEIPDVQEAVKIVGEIRGIK